MSKSIYVASGVPQGSVSGPLLFTIYINDITSCIQHPCNVKLFADDGKFYLSRADSENLPLKNYLIQIEHWVKEWQLELAVEKCCVISMGNQNVAKCEYFLQDTKLNNVEHTRDIGIIVNSNLKSSTHCASIAAKGHSGVYLLLKSFTSGNIELLIRAYTTYVRPLLESCTPVWSPYLIKDIVCIERVQKRFTKRLCRQARIVSNGYDSRLKALNLKSLEYRRIEFDLHMLYRMMNNLVDLRPSDFFERANRQDTRGHSLKLLKTHANLDCRKYFFINRTIPIWNNLTEATVNARTLDIFKSSLNKTNLADYCKV